MNVRERLKLYHQTLAAIRWPQKLYEADEGFWVGQRKTEKSTPVFEAHMRRCQGEGSPDECDKVTERMTKR